VAVTSVPVPERLSGSFRPADFDLVLSEADGIDPLLDRLRRLRAVAVVPGLETGVILGDILAAELVAHRANDPSLTAARRHKGHMVAALEARGVRTIRTLTTSSPAEAALWVARHELDGRDLVVKPALSAGSVDVTLLPGGVGLTSMITELVNTTSLFGVLNEEVVVQERVLGTEYAVDTFTCDGRHSVSSVYRCRKVANGSSFATYDSLTFVPYEAAETAALVDYVKGVLDALGIRFAIAHAEVMLTADGPVLIEIGVRPAGGDLPALCELATGDNALHRLARHLRDGTPPPPGYRLDWHVSTVYFRVAQAGAIVNTAAYERIRQLRSCRALQVRVADGDRVEATSHLLSTLALGWAVLAHRDPDQVERDRAAVRDIEQEVRVIPDP
jgi:phosphoribosylamine-glycine ligase